MGMFEQIAKKVAEFSPCMGDDGQLCDGDCHCKQVAMATISEIWECITPEMIEGMEEMYMPMGDMRAAWDGAFFAAMKEEDNAL